VFPAHFPSPTGGTIGRDGRNFHFSFWGEGKASAPGRL
jgi:hypothetical protein